MATTTDAPAGPRAGFLASMLRDIARLRDAPRELWVIYAVKFLESVAYFAVYNLLAVYLSSDLGYSDVEAGSLAGTWLLVISVLMFFSGFIADAMGIRRAILISIASCLLGRVLIAFSTTRPVAVAGLFVMTWGVASMMPTMTAAIRLYTRRDTVSFGFSLFYVIMNVGALVAPLTVAYFRGRFLRAATFALPGGTALTMTSSQLVFVVGALATLLSLVLVIFAMRPDGRVPAGEAGAAGAGRAGALQSPLQIVRQVVFEASFWRFMLFVTLLVLVRLIFQHAHLTWPKYTLREFGEGFPFAAYWSINPFMIIFLTPLVTALTRRRSAFVCIVAGSVVSALSVFFMALSTAVWASVAFIVTLSVGEALWSPRLYEYTAVIAPRGREASYMGLSQVPMFVAKPVVGFLSGYLLMTYCPATGPRNSSAMWVVIGLTTLGGPLLIYLLRNVIQPRGAAEPGVEPAVATTST